MLNQKRKLLTNNNENASTSIADDDDDALSLLSLQFSLWYPALHGKVTEPDEESDYFLLAVLAVLRDFLCQHINHILIVHPTNYSESLCSSTGNITEDLGLFADVNETIETSTGFDVLLTFGTVVISQEKEGYVDWMSWEVIYQVVQASRLATPMQIHEDFTLQSTIQDVLERSIRRGTLNQALREYMDSKLPMFSTAGDELETFQESAMTMLDQHDFSADAVLVQQIGIAILILVVCVYTMLTVAARNHRLLRERQRILETQRRQYYREEVRRSSIPNSVEHQPILPDIVLLETEEDVNLMLAVGREESLKKLQVSSRGANTSSQRSAL